MDPYHALFGAIDGQDHDMAKILASIDIGTTDLVAFSTDLTHDMSISSAISTDDLEDISLLPDDHVLPKPLEVKTLPPTEKETIIMPEIHIDNIVCTSNVNCHLDLNHCAKNLRNTEQQDGFPALFIRLKRPLITILLFASGKVVSTGASEYSSHVLALRKIIKALSKLGFERAQLQEITIVNIVANMAMGYGIRISDMCQDKEHGRYCETQIKFPCINYHIKVIQPNIVFRIFSNGKVICQSAQALQDVYDAVRLIVPVLFLFRQRNDPVDPVTLMDHFTDIAP